MTSVLSPTVPTGKKGGLGRGLSALFAPTGENQEAQESVLHLPMRQVRPNAQQPRRYFDETALTELADSIRTHGVLQPIIVRKVAEGYEIIAGERRWRATGKAGLETIPAIIRTADDREALELALLENLQREDLNPVEEAECYQQLLQAGLYDHAGLAQRLGLSRSYVSNQVRLLNLAPATRAMLAEGRIGPAHARLILSLPAERHDSLAERIEKENLTVRQVELLLRFGDAAHEADASEEDAIKSTTQTFQRRLPDPAFTKYINILQQRWHAPVRLRRVQQTGVEVRVCFKTEEEFQAFLDAVPVATRPNNK